jgi:hypothetical protein
MACAAVEPQQTSSEDKADKTYNTGSRIPVRDRNSGSAEVHSVGNQGATEIMNNRGAIVPSKSGPN